MKRVLRNPPTALGEGEKGRWDEERTSRVVIKGGPWAWEEHYVT